MISPKEALYKSWDIFKAKWKFLLLVSAVSWITQSIPQRFSDSVTHQTPNYNLTLIIATAIITIGFTILRVVINMGLTKIYLELVDHKKAEISDLFSSYKLFWRYLGGSLLYGLIVMVGVLLLIIPGIIWGIKYQFYSYLIIDKKLGPIEALKKSSELTKDKKWELFKFDLVMAAVNIVGFLALIVGLLVTGPVTSLSKAMLYRKLSSK